MSLTRCLLAAMIFVVPSAASLDKRLSMVIITAPSPLTESQKQEIKAYIDDWIPPLQDSDDKQVGVAQRALSNPMGYNHSTFFVREYQKQLTPRLRETAESKRDIVRINTLIVASALRDTASLRVLEAGLNDTNPAVRYWAAKAIANLTSKGENGPTPREQDQLLNVLGQNIEREPFEQVLQQLMLALVKLTIPQARPVMLRALNKRVSIHFSDPSRSLAAESTAMRALLEQMIEMRAHEVKLSSDLVRLFTLVSARYLIVSAVLLDEGRVEHGAMADHATMVIRADDNLSWLVATALDVETVPPPETTRPIRDMVRDEQWPSIKLRADAWEAFLIRHIRFDAGELNVKAEPEAGAARPQVQAVPVSTII